MDLNDITLPSALVADLYTSSLVELNDNSSSPVIHNEISTAEPITVKQATAGWRSLGNNQKNILVIVQYDDAVHLPDNSLTFLTGILNACKLTIADVAIVNLKNHPGATYKELTTHFRSRIALLFAVEPSSFGLPMNFPHYQIQPFAGCSFLFSPSLSDLENDKLEKSKLWVCLKRLFNL